MMVVQTKDGINEIPMDDIAKVLVETTQAMISSGPRIKSVQVK